MHFVSYCIACTMQEAREDNTDNSVSASAAVIDASSPHHFTDTDVSQSIREETREETGDEELESENGNRNIGNGAGYERLDPQEVEEARIRAQQPSVYAGIQRDNGAGYEGLDPQEVEEARRRAQQPSVYAKLQGDKLEDLYSLPKKKR